MPTYILPFASVGCCFLSSNYRFLFSFLYSIFFLISNYEVLLFLHMKAVDSYLEELIVRRELADNFCYYQPKYDSIEGAWEWARKTLMDHKSDKREQIYT